MESHRLTHLPFQPWCEECVSGKAKQDWHRRDQPSAREGTGLIQMDCFFLSPEKEEEVEDESRLVTILCLTDTVTGWPLALQLPNKSSEVAQSRYCLQNVDLYLKNLGYNKVILQHDGEPSIRALAESIQRHVGSSVRESPPKQHQSQGAVESMSGFVASQIRALWLDVRKRYPSLDVSSNLTPWLVHHAAWLIARFHVRGKDGLTPYRLTTGSDYSHPVAMHARRSSSRKSTDPQARGKMQRRWIKGIWLGKLDRDDSNVLGTSSGVIAVRSVRRLPKESQTSQELMNDMKGIPWQPRDGSRGLPSGYPPGR